MESVVVANFAPCRAVDIQANLYIDMLKNIRTDIIYHDNAIQSKVSRVISLI